jgi:predicted dehydrogenase
MQAKVSLMPKYLKAAVIGCGMIGGGLDDPHNQHILTHAHGYYSHPDCKLVACVDKDSMAIEQFIQKWGKHIHGYQDIETMLAKEKPDIVSICTPTHIHAVDIKKIYLHSCVKVIICEKPLADNIEQLTEIENIVKNSSKVFVVNYIRCFDPSHMDAISILHSNELGRPYTFHGIFTKGLYHNGSHALALLEDMFGPITISNVLNICCHDNELYGTFFLNTAFDVNGILSNAIGNNYAIFELDILLERGRIRIAELGRRIEIYESLPSLVFNGYRELTLKKVLPVTLDLYGLNSINYAISLLENDTKRLELISRQMDFARRTLQMMGDLKGKFLNMEGDSHG